MSAAAPAKSTVNSVCDFFNEHGRLPRIDDSGPRPWHYWGWLLAYVILVNETHPAVPDRWGYHLRTLQAGKLLDEPIPRIEFSEHHYGQSLAPGLKMIQKLEDIIERDHGSWTAFNELVDWLAFGMAVSREKPRTSDKISEELYRTCNIEPWVTDPSDYLGSFLSERRASGWNKSGFFPTPHSVCEMMVQMQMAMPVEDGRDRRTYSVSDPAVGSGRMLLHASNFSMRLSGQDIDPLVCKICLINGALYAPWLAFPLPATIIGERTSTAAPAPVINQPQPGQQLLFA